jgi:hypothetical protein
MSFVPLTRITFGGDKSCGVKPLRVVKLVKGA